MNLILLVLAVACLGSVQAQDTAFSTKSGFRSIVDSIVVDSNAPKLKLYGQELGSVSVTARISSLSKVDITTPQILSKAQIQRSSSADMGQLLSRVNGLQVSQDPTLVPLASR
jgi:outer membrane cobalamin receptor